MKTLKLLCILAHPDDESLGFGGTLAKYAAEGVETTLITATRGERGWTGPAKNNPGPAALGRIREAELRNAADLLGIKELILLDYGDGELDQASPDEVIRELVLHCRRIRPDVVVTFDPNGDYGHPDHIAISQFTTAALMAAADGTYLVDEPFTFGQPLPAHRVSKLYYRVATYDEADRYEAVFGDLAMTIDGVRRRSVAWEDWAVTTWVDTAVYASQVRQAVACHESQFPNLAQLQALPDAEHRALWGMQTFYRAFSLVNGGRHIEDDLFAGIRQPVSGSLFTLDTPGVWR